jgi:beta-lactamase class A
VLQRRTGIIAWIVVIVAVVALVLAWQYLDFRAANRILPSGTTMAGLSVEGLTREEAFNALEVAFSTPVEVTYQGESLTLAPDSVEFRFNVDQTAANLDAALATRSGMDSFVSHILRQPSEPVAVAVKVTYSEERLDGFLARIARQYDHPPQAAVPLPNSLTFRAGLPGYELDIKASRVVLARALVSADDRHAELVAQTKEAPPLEIEVLGDMLQSLVDSHPQVIPGIFVKDLRTGDEVSINADVAFSGLSVLKIAVMEETYRTLETPLNLEVTDWVSESLGSTSSNFKANLLLRDIIGDGSGYQGVENLTASMSFLGLRNTFMVAPYDADCPYSITTPANSRADINTRPDICMQTTPLDIGLLLEMIYQCKQGGGALMVAYPDAFTAEECGEMIEWLSKNDFDNLIEAGLPEGTVVAHKHGFGDGGPHADAGIVFSPGGDFVLIIYLDSLQYLEWAESSELVATIARATYNYFNPSP